MKGAYSFNAGRLCWQKVWGNSYTNRYVPTQNLYGGAISSVYDFNSRCEVEGVSLGQTSDSTWVLSINDKIFSMTATLVNVINTTYNTKTVISSSGKFSRPQRNIFGNVEKFAVSGGDNNHDVYLVTGSEANVVYSTGIDPLAGMAIYSGTDNKIYTINCSATPYVCTRFNVSNSTVESSVNIDQGYGAITNLSCGFETANHICFLIHQGKVNNIVNAKLLIIRKSDLVVTQSLTINDIERAQHLDINRIGNKIVIIHTNTNQSNIYATEISESNGLFSITTNFISSLSNINYPLNSSFGVRRVHNVAIGNIDNELGYGVISTYPNIVGTYAMILYNPPDMLTSSMSLLSFGVKDRAKLADDYALYKIRGVNNVIVKEETADTFIDFGDIGNGIDDYMLSRAIIEQQPHKYNTYTDDLPSLSNDPGYNPISSTDDLSDPALMVDTFPPDGSDLRNTSQTTHCIDLVEKNFAGKGKSIYLSESSTPPNEITLAQPNTLKNANSVNLIAPRLKFRRMRVYLKERNVKVLRSISIFYTKLRRKIFK